MVVGKGMVAEVEIRCGWHGRRWPVPASIVCSSFVVVVLLVVVSFLSFWFSFVLYCCFRGFDVVVVVIFGS